MMNERSLPFVASLVSNRLCIKHGCDIVREVAISSPKRWFSYFLGAQVPDRFADLVDLATIVHGVDRLVPRKNLKFSNRSWCRLFALRVPVRDWHFWKREDVIEAVQNTLTFLTEDEWECDFYANPDVGRQSPVQLSLIPLRKPVGAGLFSAGLDSLAGLAIDLNKEKYGTLVPIAVASNSRILRRQRELLRQINRSALGRLKPVILASRIRQNRRSYDQNEKKSKVARFLLRMSGISSSDAGRCQRASNL